MKAILGTVSALLVPTSAPAKVSSSQTTIMRLFRQRCELRDEINSLASDIDDEEMEIRWNRLLDLQREIMREPTTCAADFAAKAIVDTSDGGLVSDWETGDLWVEARAITGCAE